MAPDTPFRDDGRQASSDNEHYTPGGVLQKLSVELPVPRRATGPGPLENVRDVTFGEDLSTARTGTGPHVMAAIRNLVISILCLAGYATIAAALRRTARDPLRSYRLLTASK